MPPPPPAPKPAALTPAVTPPLLALPSGLALGVVVYFALRILLVSLSVVALLSLVLLGLSIGAVIRRGGVRSLPALSLLAGAVLGGLLAFVLKAL